MSGPWDEQPGVCIHGAVTVETTQASVTPPVPLALVEGLSLINPVSRQPLPDLPFSTVQWGEGWPWEAKAFPGAAVQVPCALGAAYSSYSLLLLVPGVSPWHPHPSHLREGLTAWPRTLTLAWAMPVGLSFPHLVQRVG